MRASGLTMSTARAEDRSVGPVRICFCTDHWPTFGPINGTARYVQTLARALVKLECEVHVLTAHKGPVLDAIEEGVHVHSAPVAPFRFVGRFQPGLGESRGLSHAIAALNARYRFDLVEFSNVEGIGFWFSRFGALPSIVRVHTTSFDAVRLGIGKPRFERAYARLERWTAHQATRLVTHTRSHQQQVAIDYGLDADTIAVVPHGLAPSAPATLSNRRTKTVISVGVASERKGVKDFLEVARLAFEVDPELKFLWVGRDSDSAPGGRTWKSYANERYPQLARNLTFTGPISDQALSDLYGGALCYLATSLYESFGLTVVESMMAGLAVVAPRTSAFGELIADGETGLLYEPKDARGATDAILSLLREPRRADAITTVARARALDEYSAGAMASSMLRLYRSVIDT
jgi:glycogen(starch) synthase